MANKSTRKTPPKKASIITSFVFKPEELARIDELAAEEVRSRSGMARMLINEAIKARELEAAS